VSAPNSRRIAAFIVARWLATKDFPSAMLPEGRDRAFVQDLAYTTIRRLRPLRKTLGALMRQWPKGELEALLYVGAAQVLYMPDVPDFAAVSATVDAAKMCENPSVAKVVNGVLRNLVRRRAEFEKAIAESPLEERESFPTALVRRWEARFGTDGAARLCAWHNEPAETFLARRDGSFTKLERGCRVEDVEGYAEGAFIVQDPGTRLAIELLDPKSGERVLDACAAPGGKTVQIAWRGADVTACEVNPKRRRRLEQNLARLKLGVRVISELPAIGEGAQSFQKVLVDAPCSNTGVLRRRPDARWNWSEEKLAALVKLQAEILDACASRVEPGGVLVYSTCSNEPEENMAQVEAFLARHPDFSLAESRESVPYESGTDGAFAAKLVRTDRLAT
jgi:16S rRNA (cytosine967-C5)-methyltransferase